MSLSSCSDNIHDENDDAFDVEEEEGNGSNNSNDTTPSIIVIDNIPTNIPTVSSSVNNRNGARVSTRNSSRRSNNRPPRTNIVLDDGSVAPSVDATYLASSVGSVVGPTKTAFLRSVTFMIDEPHDLQWDIVFADHDVIRKEKKRPSSTRNSYNRSTSNIETGSSSSSVASNNSTLSRSGSFSSMFGRNREVIVESLSGHLQLSKIQPGDVVTKMNNKKIGPSYNAARCTALLNKFQIMESATSQAPFISIQTGNENGIDTIIQVTVIKPRPDMTAKELGLNVWWWRGLCVRYVEPKTIFSMTPIKIDDELESINDIVLDDDSVTTDGFNKIMEELPCEITIVVKRGKQRWNGHFG